MQEQRFTRGNEGDRERLEINSDRGVMRRSRGEEREAKDDRGKSERIFSG